MFLHLLSQCVSMAKPMEEFHHPGVFVKVTHCLPIYSCCVQRGFQLCWPDQKKRGGLLEWQFVEVHPGFPISFLQMTLYSSAKLLRRKCSV